MKVVFLDFDGVLNSELYFRSTKNKRVGSIEEDHIDPKTVEHLNILVQNGLGPKVVVSSTWRRGRSVEELQKILVNKGFKGEVIDKTPVLGVDAIRGNEIHEWIHKNGPNMTIENYVILDDDSDMLYWQRNNFILVDSYCGLTPNQVYRAQRILDNTLAF